MKTNWRAIRIGCLTLVSGVISSPLLAQTQDGSVAPGTVSVISSVAITQASEHSSVRVEGEGPLAVRTVRMHDPDRLVLDFSEARLAVHKTFIPGVSAPVRGVRLGQYRPNVARVVIDLTGASPYKILREGATVVVSFAPASNSPVHARAQAPSFAVDTPNARPALRYEMASPRAAVMRSGRQARISAPRFSLPRELTQPSVLLASFTDKNEPARPAQILAAQLAAVQQAGNAAATVGNAQQAAPQATQATPMTGARYTGEPISVNLKDVDLKDFFRLIHEISGLNVVLDPAVKGSLTIVLDEVPWDQALDIVLQNNGLDKQLSGNVLRIATRDTMKKEAETMRDLERAQAEAAAPVTVTRVLSYGKAEKLKDTLKKFLSARGDILSDDRSNQLIIRDIPSVIPVIDNLIRQLDRKSQQVEIEARVVSASRSFAQDIGTQLAFSGTGLGGRNIIGGDSDVGQSNFGTTDPAPPISIAN